ARRDNHLLRAISFGPAKPILSQHLEVSVAAGYGFDQPVQARVKMVMFGHSAVILQRLVARRLLVRAWKRNVADLQQLRRGKEGHVRGVVIDGVTETALVYHHTAKACALRLNGARHSR